MDVVDEVAITGSQLEHTIAFTNPALKVEPEQRAPQGFSARVVREADLMIDNVRSHASIPQPNVRPQIMRNPTFKARRLLTLPPLLSPIRA